MCGLSYLDASFVSVVSLLGWHLGHWKIFLVFLVEGSWDRDELLS